MAFLNKIRNFRFLLCTFLTFGLSLANNETRDTADDLQRSTWIERLGISLPVDLFPTQTCDKPPKLPEGIPIRQTDFLNWSELLKSPAIWTAEPSHPSDVVNLVNWAYNYNYSIRARGFMHSWAPITVDADVSSCQKTILVDTTKHLTRMSISDSDPNTIHHTVTVQTGATWEQLLTYLEANNYGIFAYPAVGQMSIGGTLAVGAHGTGFPTKGTRLKEGFKSGSISDLVVSLEAIVWDPETGTYVIKTFDRSNEDTRAFLVHLGRAFLTQVTFQIGKNDFLRCQSITDIKSEVLFGSASADHGQTLASYVEIYDRVEAQFFPYTEKTWLKLWTSEPTKSGVSVEISKPYPYTHGNSVFRPVDRLISLLASGVTGLTPLISRMTYELGAQGVSLTRTADVWGPSKNSLLYYHHLAHKFISLGYTVLTRRDKIQKVVHKSYSFFTSLTEEMRKEGKYPMNQPLEFRITGLDKMENRTFTLRNETITQTIRPPALSFLSEVEGHPEYDVAIFMGLHYFPGTPYAAAFMRDWESFLFGTFNGKYATARVEWAKTWGFDSQASWVNSTVYRDILPQTFGSEWNWAVNKLQEYDPHNIYSNNFLQKLMAPIPI